MILLLFACRKLTAEAAKDSGGVFLVDLPTFGKHVGITRSKIEVVQPVTSQSSQLSRLRLNW